MKKDSPLIIAHRGASAYLPENTLAAFRLAVEKFNVDMIEFDVHSTRDGIPVIIHDAKLDRTTNGKGYVCERRYKDLAPLDAGYYFDPGKKKKFPERGKGIKIPALEEVLAEFPFLPLAIEIKEKSKKLTHSVVHLVKKYSAAERVIIGSKHDVVSQTLRHHYGTIRRFCSQREVLALWTRYHLRKRNKAKDPMAIASMPMRFLGIRFDTRKWIHFLHSKDIKALFWAYMNPRSIPALLHKGADGFVVDDPAALQSMLGRSSRN